MKDIYGKSKIKPTITVHVDNPTETPPIQKVEIINPPTPVKFTVPDKTKAEITNAEAVGKSVAKFIDFSSINELVKSEFSKLKMPVIPIGKGDNSKFSNPEEFVPVRLTDGSRFYNALKDAYTSASKSVFPFINAKTGRPQAATVDDNGTLQTDITVDNINLTVSGTQTVVGTKTNNSAVPTAQLGVLPAIANAATPSWTETYDVKLSEDLSGNTRVTLGTKITGENFTADRLNNEPVYSTTSITTQTTTTVRSGTGTLAGFLIPTPVATATVKIYDNTAASGTVLVDTITFPAALLNSGPIFVKLDASYATGITVVTGVATMAIDIYYR